MVYSFLADWVGMLSLPLVLRHESKPNFICHRKHQSTGQLFGSWLKLRIGVSCVHLSRQTATTEQDILFFLQLAAIHFKLPTQSVTHTHAYMNKHLFNVYGRKARYNLKLLQ